MTVESAAPAAHLPIEWPPPLDDRAVLEALTDGDVAAARSGASDIVGHLRADLSVRARATIGVALMLRERQETPLRALLATAQDLMEPETEETCENVIGLLRAGWSQGIGELLAASRSL